MKKEGNDSDVADLLSAGVIQHFELAYETPWKFLKQYLDDIFTLLWKKLQYSVYLYTSK